MIMSQGEFDAFVVWCEETDRDPDLDEPADEWRLMVEGNRAETLLSAAGID
jgi:hypothetical protein